jgi:HEAT repeat protein
MIFAISLHDTPEVLPFLKATALGRYDTDIRKSAIFWIGNMEGPESFHSLQDIAGRIRGTELRKHVVFAYSLNNEEGAVEEMIRIARSEPDREVRKNAIFWLGQKASAKAVKLLTGVVEEEDEDDDIKTSAVFAISQLPKDQSVPLLISIAKTNESASVRKNAIFWLGQTGEEEALEFFEEILLKKNPAA